MHRLIRVSILSAFALVLVNGPATMQSHAAGLPSNAAQADARLVIFETFMRPG